MVCCVICARNFFSPQRPATVQQGVGLQEPEGQLLLFFCNSSSSSQADAGKHVSSQAQIEEHNHYKIEPNLSSQSVSPKIRRNVRARERPVITVLEARPMNEVGFRGGSDAAAGRERPEITVVGARPMSQGTVAFVRLGKRSGFGPGVRNKRVNVCPCGKGLQCKK